MERIDRNLGNTENPKPELNRTKDQGENWSDSLYDLSQEMSAKVKHAFKIEYEEEGGQARGTFKGPGLEQDWDPDDEMAWIHGNPNLSLSANLEFEYENSTQSEMVERAISAVNPNNVGITVTNPESGQEHQITLEEQGNLEYEVDSEGWITDEKAYKEFQDFKYAVQTLNIPLSVEEIDDPRDPDGNRVMDDFWADFTLATENGAAEFEDYEENEEGKAERVTVPKTSPHRSISDHNYSELFSELRNQGYEVSISGDQTVSTNAETGVTIRGSEYGFTVTENTVSLYRNLEPDVSYEAGQVKKEMDEMSYWANEITNNRLREGQWEMNPINVIKPSQEQEF